MQKPTCLPPRTPNSISCSGKPGRGWPSAVGADRRFRLLPHGAAIGSIHSDFGPADQDKPTNQDYAFAWRPWHGGEPESPPSLLALSDGLTNSFRSESAAALACWVSVRALIESRESAEPKI